MRQLRDLNWGVIGVYLLLVFVLIVTMYSMSEAAALSPQQQQPDYRAQLLAQHGQSRSLQQVLGAFDPNLPIISWVTNDPNAWMVEVGQRVRHGIWSDPEGDSLKTIEVLAADGPVQVTFTQDGSWMLDMIVREGYQAVHLRTWDLPAPERKATPQSREVLVIVKGEKNEGPILY